MHARAIGMACACVAATSAGAVELQVLNVAHEDGRFEITSRIVLNAPLERVFAVLSDYESLTELHPSIRKSQVVGRPEPKVAIVETWIRGCAAIFCRTLKRRERIETNGVSEIFARTDDDSGNVKASDSRWLLEPSGDGTLVSFEASLEPAFWIPPVIGPGIVKRKLRVTLIQTLKKVESLAASESAG